MKDFKVYLLISLFTFSAWCQDKKNDGLYLEKNTIRMRFNGDVKSEEMRYVSFRKGLNINQKNHFMTFNDSRTYKHVELYPDGSVYAYTVDNVPDTIYQNYKYTQKTYFVYDKSNVENKDNSISFKHYYPLSDYYLLAIPNAEWYSYEPMGEGIYFKRLIQTFSEYPKDESNKTKEIMNYVLFHLKEHDTIPVKTYNKNDLQTRLVNTYNDKGQVIKQQVYPGPGANESFLFSLTESGFCRDLELRYQYDQKGRMSQALMYGCGEVVMQEDYTYNPDKDYIEKVTYFVAGEGAFVHPTPRFVVTFNENGDVLQKEFLPEKDTRITPDMATRYYTFEYDSHNNWIRCKLYLEGTREGEPTMTAERRIEYFK